MGEVKLDNDSFIFGFVIGGLEPESECIFHVDPIRGGQNQTCTASLSIGGPIYKKPLDGEVGRELGGFGRLCCGEFRDEIYQHLSFDRCSWLVPNGELYLSSMANFTSLPKVSSLCSICFIECSIGISMV